MPQGNDTRVSEIMMKAPVTLGPADTLDLANDIIQLGRIRHIPILNDGKLVGVLSQRDLFGAAAKTVLGLKSESQKALLRSLQIQEIMGTPVITIHPNSTVREAASLMAEKKIGCLPVLDGEGLVGLVTLTDMLRHVGRTDL
jgi:CBS domain-containing protein